MSSLNHPRAESALPSHRSPSTLLSRLAGAVIAMGLAVASARAADSPLADAAERQDAAMVRTLLGQKADINIPQADGMTALHWGAYHDDPELVKQCLEAGARAGAANEYGVTPLSLACTNGSEAVVRLLLEAQADSNETLAGGETALMTAARTGRVGPVRRLLEHGAKIDARERKGQTALMWAAADGNLDVVDALLKAGADFRTPLASGFTPLFFAVREGRSAVVFRLLEAGVDVNTPTQPTGKNGKALTPLILAIENGHFELAVNLLDAGADPNRRPAGYTPLHAIALMRKPIRGDGDPPPRGSGRLSSLDLVRALVERGAEVDRPLEKGSSGRGRFTTTGSTPFLLAARSGDIPLMRLLLELKADARLPNADKSSPLLAAAGVGALGDGDEAAATEEEAAAAVRMLLDLGADINAVDGNGETAMHGAAYQSWPQVVQLLADRGTKVEVWDRKNKWGWTPLMIAQGHRPGNFRPSPETIVAIERVLRRDAETAVPATGPAAASQEKPSGLPPTPK